MILNLVYTIRSLYVSNKMKFKLIYLLSLRVTSLYIRKLYYLVNALTSTGSIIRTMTSTKLIFTQKKVLFIFSWFFILIATRIT